MVSQTGEISQLPLSTWGVISELKKLHQSEDTGPRRDKTRDYEAQAKSIHTASNQKGQCPSSIKGSQGQISQSQEGEGENTAPATRPLTEQDKTHKDHISG
ncbi:hypothetical protein H8959_010115 [Pygathrix nigripes]